MTVREARGILKEMNKWRRDHPPYDGEDPMNYRSMPHTPTEFGAAIDVGIEALDHWIEERERNRG